MDPFGLEAGCPRAGRTCGALTVLGARFSLGSPVIAPASLTARLAPSGPVGAGVPPVAGPPPGSVGAAGLAAGAVSTTVRGIAIFATRAAVGPVTLVAVSSAVTLVAVSSAVTLVAVSSAVTLVAVSSAVTLVAVSSAVTLVAVSSALARGGCAVPPGVPVAVAAGSRRERGGYQRSGTAAYQLEPSGRFRTSPGGNSAVISRPSSPPSTSAFRTEPTAAASGTRSPETSPLGRPRPGGPPGPGAVVTLAGEFYLESSRHGPQSYTPRQRLTTAGNMHYVKLRRSGCAGLEPAVAGM